MMMRGRVIEELSKRTSYLVQPSPVQIAQDDTLVGFGLNRFHPLHLRIEIVPPLTIIDDAGGPRPKERIHMFREFTLPPEIKRQVRIQMRKDNAREQACAGTAEQKRNLFRADLLAAGAADVAMSADPRIGFVFAGGAVGLDNDGAAGG